MAVKQIEKHFERMGARVVLIQIAPEPPAVRARRRWLPAPASAPAPPIRVVRREDRDGEYLEIRYRADLIELSAQDIQRMLHRAETLD